MAGEGWMDPSTFRIMFDVVNEETGKRLRPTGKCHAFFRRLRIAVRGQIIEDIDNYNLDTTGKWAENKWIIVGDEEPYDDVVSREDSDEDDEEGNDNDWDTDSEGGEE